MVPKYGYRIKRAYEQLLVVASIRLLGLPALLINNTGSKNTAIGDGALVAQHFWQH